MYTSDIVRAMRYDLLHEMKTSPNPKPAYNALQSWLFISVLGIFVLGMIGSMVSSYVEKRKQAMRTHWPRVDGRPSGTRIVKEPPTPRFTTTLYVGECSVEYTVAGKRYTVWAGSGYLDPNQAWIADRMRECPVSHYAVHYNPKEPSDAFAERLGGPP